MTSYVSLLKNILIDGPNAEGRNGRVKYIPSANMIICMRQADEQRMRKFGIDLQDNAFRKGDYVSELLVPTFRKLYAKQALGELNAFLDCPQTVDDFVKQGCTYWNDFGDKAGNINIDYGNAWFKGVNQLEYVVNEIKQPLQSRRALMVGWIPYNVVRNRLTLPCCHYSYQFIANGDNLDMIWTQRSTDVLVGLPYDMLVAQLMLIYIALVTRKKPNRIFMNLAHCHIYWSYIDEYGGYGDILKAVHSINNELEPGFYASAKAIYSRKLYKLDANIVRTNIEYNNNVKLKVVV